MILPFLTCGSRDIAHAPAWPRFYYSKARKPQTCTYVEKNFGLRVSPALKHYEYIPHAPTDP
ncbi:MAG: hypothetical protein BWY09_01902 [Candidatus Hydrogenedentes bacterium ADurb.Bin179]|nr:MAG: hypothetical protein BWY09_01902 [Candidatus Hydrogenedentes bacterium ADurb.Bin179]